MSRYCLASAGPHGHGPDHRAAITGDDTDPHVRVQDHGALRHEDGVRKQGDGRTQTRGGAVQGADYGQLHFQQIPDELLGIAPEMLQRLRILKRGKPVEITAGAEGAAGSGQQHGPGAVFLLQLPEEPGEFLVQDAIHRIHVAVGVVDGDLQHRPVQILESERPGSRRYSWLAFPGAWKRSSRKAPPASET